jgi:outer membrane protein W
MKQHFYIFFIFSLFSIIACNTERLVTKVQDAKKLEISKGSFIGMPLKRVLNQIKPEIKFAYGNPENTSAEAIGGTYFTFYFVDKEEGKSRVSVKDTPTRITIQFRLEPKNKSEPLPKYGLKGWTKEETKKYGDMMVIDIRVSGEN